MAIDHQLAIAIHLIVAAGWTGSVAFVTLGVLPLARDGGMNATPLERLTQRLQTVSRLSGVLMLLSGGYLAGEGYTMDTLLDSSNGHLVLGMIVLWVVLLGLLEVGTARIIEDASQKKVRSPAREHRWWFLSATAVGILLFVDAALIV